MGVISLKQIMRFFAFLCIFALIGFVCAQEEENEVKFVIDAFQTQTGTIIIIIPAGGIAPGQPTISDERYVTGADIMGGERDVRLTVGSGDGNLVLSTGASNGQYTAATPNEARGNSLLQLDGSDQSMTLNPRGLFGHPANDFTAQGAFAFRVLIESDLPGNVIFRVFSGSLNNFCQETVAVPGDDRLNEYILRYDEFDTNACDFSNIGALEILIVMDDNIDVLIEEFSTWGPVRTCVCNCPTFTCALLLDLDDDVFTYYRTSQFGVFNPTTDFSTIYTTVDTNSFTTILTNSFTTLFSTGLTTIFSTGFTTFTSFFSTGFTTFTSVTASLNTGTASDASVISSALALASVAVALF